MLTAITRGISSSFQSCQLEYLDRLEINLARAVAQHQAYEACLDDLGVRVISLPPDGSAPDSVFVEDPAIVLDEIAVITRMGAESRRQEAQSLADALSEIRPLRWITAPATLEGGDVMPAGKTLYVGISRRTNSEGVEQLAALVHPFGYNVVPVRVTGCLHLKTACSWLASGRILANRKWIDSSALSDFDILDVPSDEPWAANVLAIGDQAIIPAAFPQTAGLLAKIGLQVTQLDISELAKAEAGVTCMSVLFEDFKLECPQVLRQRRS